jgi:microcystin-dependent protein
VPTDLLSRGFAATDAELAGGATPAVVPIPVDQIFLRDPDRIIQDELDAWLRFDAVIRGNGVGTFNMEIANDTAWPLSVELQEAWGIVAQRDGEIVFSGSVTKHTRTSTSVIVVGEDDNAILRDNKALSNPLQYPPVLIPPEFDVNMAQASSVMIALVNNNIGPAARPDRRVAGLIVDPTADPHVGNAITSRVGGNKSLLTYLSAYAAKEALAFRVIQSSTVPGALEFKVWAPRDRSDDAKFSTEAESAQDYSDTHQIPTANKIYLALGDGLAGNRTVLEATNQGNIDEWGRRREVWIERTDIKANGAEATQALAEAVKQTGTSRQVTITPTESPDMRWRHEWDLLDLVSFSTGGAAGTTFTELVREIHLEWVAGKGMVVTPTIGQNGATNDDQLDVMLGAMQERLSAVESNFRVPDDSITQTKLHPFMKWQVGDLKVTARTTAQAGWLLCSGQVVSQTTYAALFAAIGTAFNTGGEAIGTFRLPDFRGRFPLGAGGSYAVGAVGGTTTVSGLAHTHQHSHGGGSLVWAHTHPGSHSHGIGSHNHTITHNHLVDIDHDHPSFSSGARNNDSPGSYAEPAAASGVLDHHHSVNVPALGSTPVATGVASGGAVSGSGSGSTDPDSNVFGAAAGASPWSGGSDSDSSAADYGGGGSASVLNPYLAVAYEIYAGA